MHSTVKIICQRISTIKVTPDPFAGRCDCAIITLANAKSKVVLYFSFVRPPILKAQQENNYAMASIIIIIQILVFVQDGSGEGGMAPVASPGYAYVFS